LPMIIAFSAIKAVGSILGRFPSNSMTIVHTPFDLNRL
jgi:hypothetical protein